MCGIFAVLGCSDCSQAKRFRVLELSNRLKHRGPDAGGFYQHGDSYIAHQRLAIVDPASGNQPLFNEDRKIVAVVNGGIYNHEELRKHLATHQFLTGSDCDVIVHLYEEYGENFVNMLDGMFSFVLLDTRDNSFLVVRDAIGITSLYIGWGIDGSIWISSELKGLKDDTDHFEVFPPGSLYSSKTGGFRRWYNPPWFSEAIPSTPYDPIVLRSVLQKAVTKSLMGDVSSGVLLSGSIGSSLVAAIASRNLSGAEVSRKSNAQLLSFCIGLKGSSKLKAAREVADYLGTTHHEFHFSVQDGIDAIEEVIYHIETYDVMTIRAAIPMFLMSRKIKSLGVKMVASDEGSDEIFGGNFNLYKYISKEELHHDICREMKSLHHKSCFRANKATYAWGLETRAPFLDNEFINVAMNIDPEGKMIKPDLGFVEKWILRKAFDDKERPYLPKHILYRQDEQFSSNGVCDSWIKGLRFNAEQHVTDKMMLNAAKVFPHNPPITKEACYYRMVFERLFPQNSAKYTIPGGAGEAYSAPNAIGWDAVLSKNIDPSGVAEIGIQDSAFGTNYELDLVTRELAAGVMDNVPQLMVENVAATIASIALLAETLEDTTYFPSHLFHSS